MARTKQTVKRRVVREKSEKVPQVVAKPKCGGKHVKVGEHKQQFQPVARTLMEI